MARYGGGSITAELGVLLPLPQEDIQWAPGTPGTLEEETAIARGTWEMFGRSSSGIPPWTAMYSPRREPT